MLRKTKIQEINSILARSYFTETCFKLSITSDDPENWELIIQFIPNENYEFMLSQEYNHETDQLDFYSLESPGRELISTEKHTYIYLPKAITGISRWVDRIVEDYRSEKTSIDEMEELRKSFINQFENSEHDKNEPFSDSEVLELQKKLDDLAEKFAALEEQNAINEENFVKAKKEIEQLKKDLSAFPKSIWYRVSSSKISSLIRDIATSPEARKLVYDSVKQYLLGS